MLIQNAWLKWPLGVLKSITSSSPVLIPKAFRGLLPGLTSSLEFFELLIQAVALKCPSTSYKRLHQYNIIDQCGHKLVNVAIVFNKAAEVYDVYKRFTRNSSVLNSFWLWIIFFLW